MQEVFRDIKGYEGLYQVSNFGKVKSLPRDRNNQFDYKCIMRKFTKDKDGYHRLSLSKKGIKKSYFVHRLVAEAFISNPQNKPQINHKDGDRQNNFVSNLEWCTCKENINHAFEFLGRTGKKGINRGESCGKSKLNRQQVQEIRNSKLSGRRLAPLYGVSFVQINRIKSGATWGWL